MTLSGRPHPPMYITDPIALGLVFESIANALLAVAPARRGMVERLRESMQRSGAEVRS